LFVWSKGTNRAVRGFNGWIVGVKVGSFCVIRSFGVLYRDGVGKNRAVVRSIWNWSSSWYGSSGWHGGFRCE